MNEKWYNIQNKAGSATDVYIFDEIGMWGITAQNFITDIKDLKDTPINLRINSLGGDVFDGLAIYNIIKKRTAKTTVYIEGIAASIATIIALGADEVVMSENSLFMIHNASGGAMGESKDLQKTADVLNKITRQLAEVYEAKTGLSQTAIQDMMDAETWLNAQEALDLGFIDTISDAIKVAAKYDVSKFKNITQEEIKNKLSININNKKMTNELKEWFNSKVEEIVASAKGGVVVPKNDAGQTAITVNLGDNEDIKNKISELDANATVLSNKITSLEEELVSEKGNNETLTVEVEGLNAKINKAGATGTPITTDGDPVITPTNTVLDANAVGFNALAEMIKQRVK